MSRWSSKALWRIHWSRFTSSKASARWDRENPSSSMQILFSLQISGEINVTINDWLTVSCCLPHRSISMNCSLPIDYAYEILSNAEHYFKYSFCSILTTRKGNPFVSESNRRTYYGLLLVIDPTTLLNALPTDSSATLSTLVRHTRSSYSLTRLSIETGIPIAQVNDRMRGRWSTHWIYF